MKKVSFLIDKKIVYVNYEVSKNKNAYLKITRDNELLLTAPVHMSLARLVRTFTPRVKQFLTHIANASNNILYSLPDRFVFLNGKKLELRFLTGYLQSRVKTTSETLYLLTPSGDHKECEMVLKNYFNNQLLRYVRKRQPYFERKMQVPRHTSSASYKFVTWASNNIQLQKINYSSRLIHFDQQTIDYVIVHELAHFLVPNHSRRFYDVVKNVLPNHRQYAKRLNYKLD